MRWEFTLGGRFIVKRDGLVLPPAPTRTVSVLLCGLAVQNGDWLPRSMIESKLYPEGNTESRKSALRQTLSRMRVWLGDCCVESLGGSVRLISDSCSIDVSLSDGSRATFLQIAPGISHPWMDELRSSWCGHSTNVSWEADGFVESVCTIGEQDADVGRSMLLGGASLLDHVQAPEVARMLLLTKPAKAGEPQAAEHALLRAQMAFRFLSFAEAGTLAGRAWRIAKRKKQAGVATDIAAWMIFFSLEQGKDREARDWLTMIASDRGSLESRLLASTATMAYYWNMGDTTQAASSMRDGLAIIDGFSRRQQLHHWVNASIFSSESGDLGLAREALSRAESLWVESLDIALGFSLKHARVELLAKTGYADEAVRLSESVQRECITTDHQVGALYAAESGAVALRLAGRHREAVQAWKRSEAHRRAIGSRPTERLRRMRAAVL